MEPVPLCLMQVHAHPDDEASKGAATTARYAAEGARNVLVTCTGGEAGDILNPAADTPEVRADLGAVRMRELDASVKVLGYDAVYLLGYRDSGMPDSEHNKHPEAFANVPLDEAIGKLVGIIEQERPHVIVAYGEDNSRYPHPDHIRAHEIARAAFDLTSPELWGPRKLYYVGWTLRALRALHAKHLELGIESPYERWLQGRDDDHDAPFATRIEVGAFLGHRREALRAHATQIAPDSFWMALPVEAHAAAYPYEEYQLARSLVEVERDADGFETDLLSGLR